jgi:hypothetical protein
MAVIVKKKRLFNPHNAKAAKRKPTVAQGGGAKRTHPKRTRKNPGQLITLGLVNPQKKRTAMKTKSTTTKKHAPRKSNPFFAKKKATMKTRRRNPSFARKPMDLAKSGITALLGLVATRQIPQMLLSTKNAGWLGYASNLGVAALAGALVSRFYNKDAGKLVFIGGSVYTVSRILTEQFSPIGKYFSLTGVGDAQAAGLGVIRDGYFPVPVVRDDNGNPMIPRAIVEAARPAPVPAPAAAMSGLSRYQR